MYVIMIVCIPHFSCFIFVIILYYLAIPAAMATSTIEGRLFYASRAIVGASSPSSYVQIQHPHPST